MCSSDLFEHDDPLPREPGLVQERQRDAGRLAGPWRGLQYGTIPRHEVATEFGEDLFDREGGHAGMVATPPVTGLRRGAGATRAAATPRSGREGVTRTPPEEGM